VEFVRRLPETVSSEELRQRAKEDSIKKKIR
jgi:hypothetical protein